MTEEVVGVFDARCLMLEEYGVGKSCVLFFTHNRIVVGILEGISLKLIVAVVISAAVALIGLFLRDLILFLAGLVAVFVVGSLLILTDFIVRSRRKSRVKGLAPQAVLKMSAKNFEISYSDIVKVKHSEFERYGGGSRFFLPTPPELMHEIEFATSEERYAFILDINDLDRCLNLLNQFVSEKIEKDGDEEF